MKNLVLLSLSFLSALWGGEIRGSITDENGTALSAWKVSIHLRSVPDPSNSPELIRAVRFGFNQETRTNALGQFAFRDAPPGLHQICVAENGDYFDPCFWDRSANLHRHEGQAVHLLEAPIRLERGHRLRITLRDPSGVLPARDLRTLRGPLDEEVQVSVRTPVLGHWAVPPRASAAGRYFEFLVPFGKPIPVNVEGRGLRLTDSDSGKTAATVGRVLTFRREQPRHLTFDVSR